MRYTEEHIRFLLKEIVDSPTAKQWKEQRLLDHQRWKEWIDPVKFAQLSNKEINDKFLEYFNEGAGRHPFMAVFRDRIIRKINRFKDLIVFLIDDKIPIENRLNQVLTKDEKYKITGFGKALTTSILMDLDSQKYATWNNKTIMGLRELGMYPKFPRGSGWGTCYNLVMDALNYLKSLRPDLSYIEIDHFLHIIAVEDEGKEALEKLVKNQEIISEVSQRIEEILDSTEEIEYLSKNKSINVEKLKDGAFKAEFTHEPDGRTSYKIEGTFTPDLVHGKVVNTLQKILKHKGFDAYNDKNRDLFILKNKEIAKLFEVKTSTCSTSIKKV